jgi:16S rRNA (guanine527-N7)-methyltransferase
MPPEAKRVPLPDSPADATRNAADPRDPALRQGLDALGLAADDTAMHRLFSYADLLLRWNRHYNLTAVRDPQAVLHQHVLDCLALLPALDRHLQQQTAERHRLLDVGSGAGLPGALLAIMRPQWDVTCVDAVSKKTAFVQQAALEIGIDNLRSVHARVEDLRLPPFFFIVSRAFASLDDFTRLTRRQLSPSGCWVAMKGRVPGDEIAALPKDVEVFHVEQLLVPGLDAQRCLIWMRPASPPATPG